MVTLKIVIMTLVPLTFPEADGPIRTTHEIPVQTMEKCERISEEIEAARPDYQNRTSEIIVSTECIEEGRTDVVLPAF